MIDHIKDAPRLRTVDTTGMNLNSSSSSHSRTQGDLLSPPKIFPFRVQFSTPVVKPSVLPEFPYVVTRLEFGVIVYTAILRGHDLSQVIAVLREYWPGAEPQEAEAGVPYFRNRDMLCYQHRFSQQFGAVQVAPRPGWWKRLFSLLVPKTADVHYPEGA